MSRRGLWALCAVAMLWAAGCGPHAPSQKLVVFSQANNAEPYRAAQKALMGTLFSQMSGVKLVVSDAEQDNSKQIAQIETFIRQRPAVLIVAPNERAALTSVMGEALAAGIPVICLERDIVQPNYTTYIRIDHVRDSKRRITARAKLSRSLRGAFRTGRDRMESLWERARASGNFFLFRCFQR